jgi:hypothetical protein
MASEITVGLIGLAGAALGGAATYFATKKSSEGERAIAREKLETENRLANSASAAIRELLLSPQWELRSFEAIKKHIRGFSDDELRKLLVASGAVSFDQQDTGRELWGLRERNADKLAPPAGGSPLIAAVARLSPVLGPGVGKL